MLDTRSSVTRLVLAGTATIALTLSIGSIAKAETNGRQDGVAMGSQIRKHEGGSVRGQDQTALSGGSTDSVAGIDVSNWNRDVNWADQWRQGKRFAWIKATEGTYYKSPSFSSQYTGSYKQGFIRGAYHFARPDRTSGAEQAKFFSDNGGGWSADGKTLPGVIDLEYNPYGPTCYGKSKSQMAQWIRDFSNYYKNRWNKYPAIYTSTSWWDQCVGTSFSKTNPLWVARYNSSVGKLPYDWSYYTVWQYSDKPIDQNRFSGSYQRLQVFAKNSD